MALTQETFLGASIRNFNASLGWGTQASTLEVGLVEDTTNGDVFDPPVVGSPVYFEYQNWHFGGLLQSYTKSYGQNGNPIYNVQVQDPRELLAGVQLILQDYADNSITGSVVPNIYNIYGYIENKYGFGASQVNDTGIPWYIIVQALSELEALYPIRFRGNYFRFVPFYGMSYLLPSYYRIGGDSISLLDFVNEICEAVSADYFIGMTYAPEYVGYANNIGLHMIDRSQPLADDKIEEFIEDVEGAVAKEIGHELRNEVTTKFLTGGKVNALYYQPQQYTENDRFNYTYDNTIWPYWGYDCFDRLVIMNINGTFRLDGRVIALETNQTWMVDYPTDIGEMRAAADSQESWEAYLWAKNSDTESVHYGKAFLLGISDGLNPEIKTWLEGVAESPDGLKVPRPQSLVNMASFSIQAGWRRNQKSKSKLEKIYEWISTYANEYYGRKFMVRIPFVLGAQVPETNEIRFSVNPSDGGYIDETEWAQAAWNKLIPFNPAKFTLDDGRISSYVRFSRVQSVDFDEDDEVYLKLNNAEFHLEQIDPANYIIEQIPNVNLGRLYEQVWVRAEIDPQLVFIDPTTLFSPRVVVTIPGRVTTGSNDDPGTLDNLFYQIIMDIMNNAPVLHPNFTPAVRDRIAKDLASKYGSDVVWFDQGTSAVIPDMAGVALESNLLRYGPWYAAGSAGKVEYEADETMVPWNYGGYTLLNLSGNSRVSDALSSLQVSEKGVVEFPGVPNKSLGEALLTSGPTVTDISVNISEQGVTTKYNMSTWTWRFGRAGKYNLDRILRINRVVQNQRKHFRELYSKAARPGQYTAPTARTLRWINKARRHGHHSSVGLLAGDVIVGGSGDTLTVSTNVAAIAGYRVQSQTEVTDYPKQAGMSLDGMFVPYTTATSGDIAAAGYTSYLPKFEQPADGASTPTVNDLNPFGERGIAVAFPESEELPASLNTELNTVEFNGDVKGIGLKAPIVVGGWGRTTTNSPVPADPDDSTEYAPNYKSRADLWKVGPLDIRWDEQRKVWNASGGGANVRAAILTKNMSGGSYFGSGILYESYIDSRGYELLRPTTTHIKVVDWLGRAGTTLYSGDRIIVAELDTGGWLLVNAWCSC